MRSLDWFKKSALENIRRRKCIVFKEKHYHQFVSAEDLFEKSAYILNVNQWEYLKFSENSMNIIQYSTFL